jgi:hypothetical protein
MYVYTIIKEGVFDNGASFEVIAVSENIETLKKRLRHDVQKYVDEVYDEESFAEYGLTPIDQIDEFWSDESTAEDLGSYQEFHVFEVPVV